MIVTQKLNKSSRIVVKGKGLYIWNNQFKVYNNSKTYDQLLWTDLENGVIVNPTDKDIENALQDTLNRDLRASLREFLTLSRGLTYDQCVEIANDFTAYLVQNTDDQLMLTDNDKVYTYWAKVDEYKPNLHK